MQEYEHCIICGKKTGVLKGESVTDRPFYVIGLGELCYDCFEKLYMKEWKDGRDNNAGGVPSKNRQDNSKLD